MTNIYIEDTLAVLERYRKDWKNPDDHPNGVGTLSGGQYRALVLATGHERLLSSPLQSFLDLDDWLQNWVLESRGLGLFRGMRIGR